MSFMESYKDLDKSCKTFSMYPKGISSYIETMELCKNPYYKCLTWTNDYQQLKRLRHLRNKISHDSGVTEANSCVPEDEAWIQSFHSRLLDGTDPLAIYDRENIKNTQKATYGQAQSFKKSSAQRTKSNSQSSGTSQQLKRTQKQSKSFFRRNIGLFIAVGAVFLTILMIFTVIIAFIFFLSNIL